MQLGFFSITKLIMMTMNPLKNPAITAIVICLLSYHPFPSWAASGGRMGGRAFSSDDTSSSTIPSYRTSLPSYDSYRYSSPSRNSYNSDEISTKNIGGGGKKVYVKSQEGSGLLDVEVNTWQFWAICSVVFVVIIWLYVDWCNREELKEKSIVIKLQVGLLGSARTLQIDLDQIAEAADTSIKKDLNFILSETTFALLCHSDYWASACSSMDITMSFEKLEKRFEQLSIAERGKLFN